ncbi:MAG TPA: class I SAM-dependent methyltransferase [Chitinophagaceae bacterium]|nr:class I SAM-dependent methyltransferase [Chitinophagaceae bacterium]
MTTPQVSLMKNINDSYFDGYYKEIWRSLIPAELTAKELEFMFQYFSLQPGDQVLDLMCGYGRHAIGLAEKGIKVTAIDNLGDYIDEVQEKARLGSLPVEAIKADISRFEAEGLFDLAICMGNSLNFFNAADTAKILRQISAHLKPGAHFLLNSWSIAEIALKNFKEKNWNRVGELKLLTESTFLFDPTRIETNTIFISPSGGEETKKAIDYIFSVNELQTMVIESGMIWKEIYSIPGRKKFTLGEPRAYIIAQKPG